MDHVLPDLIRSSREAKGISQIELARRLKMAQSTVSGWEGGRIVPGPDRIKPLSKLLGLSEEDLKFAVAAQASATESMSRRGMNASEYVREVSKYFSGLGTKEIDAWVITPVRPPVQNHSLIQENWIENIAAGLTYNIIWAIDSIEDRAVLDIVMPLNRVAVEASRRSGATRKPEGRLGGIRHYFCACTLSRTEWVAVLDSGAGDDPMFEFARRAAAVYRTIFTQFKALNNPIHAVRSFSFLTPPVQAQLARWFSSFGPTVLFNHPLEPVASACVLDARSSVRGPDQTVFQFVSNSASRDLQSFIAKFTAVYDKFAEVNGGLITPGTEMTAAQSSKVDVVQ